MGNKYSVLEKIPEFLNKARSSKIAINLSDEKPTFSKVKSIKSKKRNNVFFINSQKEMNKLLFDDINKGQAGVYLDINNNNSKQLIKEIKNNKNSAQKLTIIDLVNDKSYYNPLESNHNSLDTIISAYNFKSEHSEYKFSNFLFPLIRLLKYDLPRGKPAWFLHS